MGWTRESEHPVDLSSQIHFTEDFFIGFFHFVWGALGKKRMAGVDGFEGVKPIDDVRVDVFEMGNHFCNETGFFGR